MRTTTRRKSAAVRGPRGATSNASKRRSASRAIATRGNAARTPPAKRRDRGVAGCSTAAARRRRASDTGKCANARTRRRPRRRPPTRPRTDRDGLAPSPRRRRGRGTRRATRRGSSQRARAPHARGRRRASAAAKTGAPTAALSGPPSPPSSVGGAWGARVRHRLRAHAARRDAVAAADDSTKSRRAGRSLRPLLVAMLRLRAACSQLRVPGGRAGRALGVGAGGDVAPSPRERWLRLLVPSCARS